MAALSLAYREDAPPVARPRRERLAAPRLIDPRSADPRLADPRLADLADLGSADIETSLASSLSGDLHALFDPVVEGTLPIYFGPLLGRLYLEGL